MRIRGYRDTVRIGLLVGASGFTSDAKKHELRFASERGTIVFVGPSEIEGLVRAEDLEDFFEEMIRKAMLR